MKMITRPILIAAIILAGIKTLAQSYFNQDPPGSSPTIFAPGILSTNLKQRDVAISPDGTEIYYTIFNSGFDGDIYFVKLAEEVWSFPAIASFSGDKKDLEPAFTPDGSKLFFSSKRGTDNYNIWYVERKNDGLWSDPIDVGSPVNTSVNEFYPSIVNDGSIYYTAAYSNGVGGEDIWYAQYLDGVYQTPVALEGVSESTDEFNAFVDPKEQYIYFSSFGRSDGFGGGDLYWSRKQSDGKWGKGVNLGSQVNSNKLDYCPFISPDGKFLFFTSDRIITSPAGTSNPFDVDAVINSLVAPGNGVSNIYWKKRF